VTDPSEEEVKEATVVKETAVVEEARQPPESPPRKPKSTTQKAVEEKERVTKVKSKKEKHGPKPLSKVLLRFRKVALAVIRNKRHRQAKKLLSLIMENEAAKEAVKQEETTPTKTKKVVKVVKKQSEAPPVGDMAVDQAKAKKGKKLKVAKPSKKEEGSSEGPMKRGRQPSTGESVSERSPSPKQEAKRPRHVSPKPDPVPTVVSEEPVPRAARPTVEDQPPPMEVESKVPAPLVILPPEPLTLGMLPSHMVNEAIKAMTLVKSMKRPAPSEGEMPAVKEDSGRSPAEKKVKGTAILEAKMEEGEIEQLPPADGNEAPPAQPADDPAKVLPSKEEVSERWSKEWMISFLGWSILIGMNVWDCRWLVLSRRLNAGWRH